MRNRAVVQEIIIIIRILILCAFELWYSLVSFDSPAGH